jgi:ribosomal-protein-alanine N-acetyltransferase
MDFRRSVPDDATAMAEIEALVFPDPWSKRDFSDLICSESGMCFSAVDNGRVIAYVAGRLIAPEGEIYRVAVRPEYQKRGIGYRLLDYAVKSSRGRGLEVIFLEVRSRNSAAISLYSAYGFEVASIRQGYYKNPSDDALIMIKASRADILEN